MSSSGEVAAGFSTHLVPHEHAVQFYEDESYLYDVVAQFIEGGLIAFEPVIVVATPQHRDGFVSRLSAKGFDVESLLREGHLQLFDARETLALFMDGRLPDRERCKRVIGGILQRAVEGRATRVRAYGEMVDVLWREGAADAAIRLETIWNELSTEHQFTLLCAYPIANFYKQSHGAEFDTICAVHSTVAPTESRSGEDRDALLRQIAALQQRAEALKTELENRTRLEHALRDALNQRWDTEEALHSSEKERAFMLEATTVLHQSLDYESRLGELARLVVPRLAEWCAVDIAREDGTVERVTTAGLVPSIDDRLTMPMRVGERVLGWITLAGHHASEALANELARRAAIAIENSRLYRLAQEGSRAKDEFLATLSHELRTPLTAILGWARMLRLGPLEAGITATAHETIERCATAQAALIDDILDLSNAVGGKVSLQMNRVDLVSVVVAAIESLRLASTARRVRVEFHPSNGPAFVTGDAARLQQVVWNLLSNAIKFSAPDGTVHIDLEDDGRQARVVVRDHGRGIRREFLPHVFEAFRQAESTTTRTHGGLGLGLAIVKSLVELHGGSIAADSAGEDQGATFTVTLPSS
jgi:signal transduction histidine kinase